MFCKKPRCANKKPLEFEHLGKDGVYSKIYDKLGEYEWIYGENLYGQHSIVYDKLPEYYHIFAARDDNKYVWYSWDDVVLMAETLNLPTVPLLWRGVIESEEQLRKLVDFFVSQKSAYGDTREGVVLRAAGEFPIDTFSQNVCKWVRPNHVQTDEHWTRNWKKAEIMSYQKTEDGDNSVQ